MAEARGRARHSVPGVVALAIALLAGCRVSRQVHEPREYPELKLGCSTLQLKVVDLRPPGASPTERRLALPVDFEAAAQSRLNQLVAGSGPILDVKVEVLTADEVELVDTRGEITRVNVRLAQEVSVHEGPVLGRSEEHSRSDIPRAEATPAEIDFVLRATVLDAFDRKWAERATLEVLQRRLEAYARKAGGAEARVPVEP